jgi:hypothetical protein
MRWPRAEGRQAFQETQTHAGAERPTPVIITRTAIRGTPKLSAGGPRSCRDAPAERLSASALAARDRPQARACRVIPGFGRQRFPGFRARLIAAQRPVAQRNLGRVPVPAIWSMSPSVDSSHRASVPLTCTRKKTFDVFRRRGPSASRYSHVRRNGRDEVELPGSLSVQRRGGQRPHVAQRNQRPARGHPWLALDLMQLDAAVKRV